VPITAKRQDAHGCLLNYEEHWMTGRRLKSSAAAAAPTCINVGHAEGQPLAFIHSLLLAATKAQQHLRQSSKHDTW
jgi:hypothetical protein